jgi:cytidyltransferase-like protein
MGKANTHLTHLEELVLTQGPAGYKMARAFLLELLKTLKGNTDSSIQTSVKWDGAPAIFAGINPENGRFFVGTKSIFNKVPKINYTEEDVLRNHGHAPGLVDKLVKALKYLPPLGIRNILQGDFMFDDEMIETVTIDGEPHYTFKPNTILYAVPVNSDLGQQIGRSKFGIVFHTTYDSLDSGATFGADVSTLRRVPGVWFDDAFFTDDTGVVTLTEDEEAQVVRLVREADTVNENIDYSDLPLDLLNIYINSEIKSGSFLENAEDSFNGFINWFSQRLQKRINNLKSEKGRQRATNTGTVLLNSFNNKREDFINLFKVSRLLFEAKNIFIEKYNNAVYNTKHFVDDGSGDLVVTNPEGYVAVDHQGNGVKFVDRLEFSRANFAVDKGDKFGGQVSETEIIGEDPQEIELEFEDENEDPVVDSNVSKTVAVVPGAFKPPHKGHLDMVQKYAGIADEVIVLISKPVKAGRRLPNGREITADDSLKIWKLLTVDIPNVDVRISDHASPINAAYEYVGEEGPLNVGDKVILGCSAKDCDWKRWTGAQKYIKKGVELLTPEGTAVTPMQRSGDKPFSATDFRNALGNPENRDEIAEFVGEENVDNVLKILGLSSNMEEQASMGGGGVAIGTAPLASGSDKPAKRDKKKRTDEKLKLANEVMRLIIERGILK